MNGSGFQIFTPAAHPVEVPRVVSEVVTTSAAGARVVAAVTTRGGWSVRR